MSFSDQRITTALLLIESDLVFDPKCLAALQTPDRIAIAGMKPWINDTVVTLDRKALELRPVFFDNTTWYKIDTIQDLAEAEKIFSDSSETDTPQEIPWEFDPDSENHHFAATHRHLSKD